MCAMMESIVVSDIQEKTKDMQPTFIFKAGEIYFSQIDCSSFEDVKEDCKDS